MTELKFTKTHEWLSIDQKECTIGITEHAQQLLGDMVFVELPNIGRKVSMGDEIGVVESVKAASDFYTPVSGTVISVNDSLGQNPGLVNSDPYGAGWLVKIAVQDPSEFDELLSKSEYDKEMNEEH